MTNGNHDTDETEQFTCWCGDTGDVDAMFSEDSLEEACGGIGTLHCFCGGDFCVCHHHGETECPGCVDCEERDGTEDEDAE